MRRKSLICLFCSVLIFQVFALSAFADGGVKPETRDFNVFSSCHVTGDNIDNAKNIYTKSQDDRTVYFDKKDNESARDKLKLSAKAACLLDFDSGAVLYNKNMEEKLPMASTTKIMTALLAIENCRLDDVVCVPADVCRVEGSSLYLREGDVLSVRDLVYSCLLQSANDASLLLALKVSGDVDSFCDLMNRRAFEIGAFDTCFKNPHGLDCEGHFTTAKDLALIAREAMKNEVFRKVVSTYKYSFPCTSLLRTVVNHNKLLKKYDGCIGVKTGFTNKSGRCLVGACERDGMTLISVTLDAPDDWADHKKMFDYGFSEFQSIAVKDLVDVEFSVPVIGGKEEVLNAYIENPNLKILKRKNGSDVKYKIILPRYMTAPIGKNQKVGAVVFTFDDKVLTVNILADDNIKKLNRPLRRK